MSAVRPSSLPKLSSGGSAFLLQPNGSSTLLGWLAIKMATLLTGFRGALILAALLVTASPSKGAEDPGAAFDAANKLYEQGRYADAAAAYDRLLQAGALTETLYFNLGNAWFKAGQLGQAISSWRRGEQLSPRDPSLRFNLQFARKKVSGSDAPAAPAWSRALQSLTLNEWTVIASIGIWTWFLLLAWREFRPGMRRALGGYTATAGVVALLLIACMVAATRQLRWAGAVVVVPEAVVRSGPLEEAKVLYQFRDGIELSVIDEKEFAIGNEKQLWLHIRDAAGRMGWLKSDQVALLQPRKSTG